VSRTIYAIHGRNPLNYDGWVVLTEGIGYSQDTSGADYTDVRHTPIVRLNNGYGGAGTIPLPEHYAAFAARCGRFVAASRGCRIWIIGNEMNHTQERPFGHPILPSDYARCYNLCYDAIHAQPGHEDDEVLVGAVAPYNAATKYPGNEGGDWVQYFRDVVRELDGVDGFALHCYGRAQTTDDPSSEAKMGGEFSRYYNGFRCYRDFINALSVGMRGLPLYITETNPGANGEPWRDEKTGWVQAAYHEIDDWNQAHAAQIRCLALYRWEYDWMLIKDKPNVQEDFLYAVTHGYQWGSVPEPPEPPEPEPPPVVEPKEIVRINVSLGIVYEDGTRDRFSGGLVRQDD